MTIAMLMKNTVNLALLTLGQSGSVILTMQRSDF